MDKHEKEEGLADGKVRYKSIKAGSGKTSMRSIIFANYVPRDTRRLGATIDVEHSHVRFLGNLVLNLWDCGGQESFMENYLASARDQIFRNVEVLIYVFDVESRELQKDMHYFTSILESLQLHSPDAKIFCLVHKMDLIPQSQREEVYLERQVELLNRSAPLGLEITTFGTSIWDATLYQSWSSIVYSLIPNVTLLEKSLFNFCTLNEADEVILFERTTFLVISHATRTEHQDANRFEKVSNIIKQFKLGCSKSQAQFVSMEIRNPGMSIFIQGLTSNTVIMIVISNSDIQSAIPLLNVENARSHFDAIEQRN